MKKIFLMGLILYSICYCTEYMEVVHLKNGDIIKGKIIENVINEYVKVELQGGSILTFPYSDIEKLTKDKTNNKQSSTQTSSTNTQQLMMYQMQKKNEGTAMLFSFLLPTAGHAYAGNWGRGLGFAAAEVGLYIAALTIGMDEVCEDYYYSDYYSDDCYYYYYEPNELFWIGFIGAIGTRFYEIFDAGKEVKNYNQRLLMQYNMNPGFSMNIIPQKNGASLYLAYNF